jgi:type IV fimbrial biogenesis protein FimT
MLEPMMRQPHVIRQAGFTLIEALVVVALIAIILAVAAPSFTESIARKRVEGLASELGTDLQYARSEAVARNAAVRLTLGTSCYAIHLAGAAVASNCAVTPAASQIKLFQLDAGLPVTLAGANSLAYIEFDPVRGTANWNAQNTTCGLESDNITDVVCGAINVESTTTTAKLRVMTAFNGRVRTCSQSGSIKGYASDHCS